MCSGIPFLLFFLTFDQFYINASVKSHRWPVEILSTLTSWRQIMAHNMIFAKIDWSVKSEDHQLAGWMTLKSTKTQVFTGATKITEHRTQWRALTRVKPAYVYAIQLKRESEREREREGAWRVASLKSCQSKGLNTREMSPWYLLYMLYVQWILNEVDGTEI